MAKVIGESSDFLLIDLEGELMSLSTSGCPKVYERARYLAFKRVPKDFEHVDLDEYCREVSRSLGVDIEETALFFTAVDLRKYSKGSYSHRGVKAEAFVTYGVDSPSCFEERRREIGTINVAVIVEKPMSRVGLLDLFRTVSEIKGMSISLGGPMCPSHSSVGTASDATMVASPQGDESFGGIATDVGISASLALLEAISQQIASMPLKEYMAKTLGFGEFDELTEMAMRAYRKAPLPSISDEQAKREIAEEMISLVKDPNLRIIVRSARLAESFLSLKLFPGREIEEYMGDSPGIIADEVIGKAIAEYINGFRGLLAYSWIDRMKDEDDELEKIGELPPMTDDVVGALIGGALSRIYDRYSRK
ncbi:MAG: adenosylcobinamide amidohydrolase [Fervidicoccaceae archaeon]